MNLIKQKQYKTENFADFLVLICEFRGSEIYILREQTEINFE